jgi:radical SAM protein
MPLIERYDERPFIVLWELTRACALAYGHCRADAIAFRDPKELHTEEAMALLDEIERFGNPFPLLVLTGGDPLRWPNVELLIESAAGRGFRVALTPSATGAATRPKLRMLRDAGLACLAVSLDGPSAEAHDSFRRVNGSYSGTMLIIDSARAIGLPIQINSSITRQTYPHLAGLADVVTVIAPQMWALFFLAPTGRARRVDQIAAWECESALNDLYDLAGHAPFRIKTTEAPQYRRVVVERNSGIRRDGRAPMPPPTGALTVEEKRRELPPVVNDGKGLLFIDHIGDVYPSDFLPISVGNVRSASLVRLYREHPLFKTLRDPDALTGRCSICPFRNLCGGSRSRAYSVYGDYLADDPACIYDPSP